MRVVTVIALARFTLLAVIVAKFANVKMTLTVPPLTVSARVLPDFGVHCVSQSVKPGFTENGVNTNVNVKTGLNVTPPPADASVNRDGPEYFATHPVQMENTETSAR